MERKSIILIGVIFFATFTLILSGCSKNKAPIKIGVYVTDDGFSHLLLEEEKTFVLQRDSTSSYAPNGKYIINGDKLLLNVDSELEKNTIEFKINGDTLIFESGEAVENQIKKGTKFVYRDEK